MAQKLLGILSFCLSLFETLLAVSKVPPKLMAVSKKCLELLHQQSQMSATPELLLSLLGTHLTAASCQFPWLLWVALAEKAPCTVMVLCSFRSTACHVGAGSQCLPTALAAQRPCVFVLMPPQHQSLGKCTSFVPHTALHLPAGRSIL